MVIQFVNSAMVSYERSLKVEGERSLKLVEKGGE
jgi:hypothetical protein